MAIRSASARSISSSVAEGGQAWLPGEAVARRVTALLTLAGLLGSASTALADPLGAVSTALAASAKDKAVPWSVGLHVHWGAKKNREAYRSGFETALLGILLEKACFKKVAPEEPFDLVLDVELEELKTEQEYQSTESMVPGQGEEHLLRSARAGVTLDYALRTPGPDGRDILEGHFHRETARQPQFPQDNAEARALNDLTEDAARWVVREICDRRGRLAEKIGKALASPPPPASAPAPR